LTDTFTRPSLCRLLDGEDLRTLRLLKRKQRLPRVVPKSECRLRGRDLYRGACDRDLEGIAAKCAPGTSQSNGASRLDSTLVGHDIIWRGELMVLAVRVKCVTASSVR
jgi:hypothetical protein